MGIKTFVVTIMFFVCFVILSCQENNRKEPTKLRVRYEYETTLMNTSKQKWKVFFIVDSSHTINYQEKTFYKFTFSYDSLDATGYVHFDKASNVLNFLPYDLRKNAGDSNNVQPIFLYKKGSSGLIRSLGVLGSYIELVSEKSKLDNFKYITTIRRTLPLASESRYIKKLFFLDNIFPDELIVIDPVLEKEVRVKGIPY
jgi:hypothetical protein